MAKWLLEDIDSKIDPNQYGNRKGVSTTHYLLKLMDTLHTNASKPAHLSNVVITDFSKALDLVDRNILMKKFNSMAVRPFVVTWIIGLPVSWMEERNVFATAVILVTENAWMVVYLKVPKSGHLAL